MSIQERHEMSEICMACNMRQSTWLSDRERERDNENKYEHSCCTRKKNKYLSISKLNHFVERGSNDINTLHHHYYVITVYTKMQLEWNTILWAL